MTVLKHLFNKFGFEVVTAINGHLAFEEVRASRKMFDLIVLDLDMPVADGYEALTHIKKYINRQSISHNVKSFSVSEACSSVLGLTQPYIIAASGYVDTNIRKKCMDRGFDDVFEMPIDCESIETLLLPILHTRRQEAMGLSKMVERNSLRASGRKS